MAELPHLSRLSDLRSLELLVDDWPDAVFVYDGDDEQYLFANKAAERLIGYRRDEIRRLQPGDFSHPDDAREIATVRVRAERDGWVRRPWRVIRRDGSVVDTEVTLTRRRIGGRTIAQGVFRVMAGAPAGRIRNGGLEARLASLERTSLAVVTLDRDGIVTSWNAGAAELFRLRADETVGRQVRDLARSAEDRADVESLMRPHTERDEWVSRLTIRRPADQYEALVTCSAIRSDDGELSGFLLITAPLDAVRRSSTPRMRRARVECAACGREVAGTMRRKYCSEKCRQWAYYHRHLEAQRERSRLRHKRRRVEPDGGPGSAGSTDGAGDRQG